MAGSMYNNIGWINSSMNYDMMSTNPWNSMNLHMNQMYDHSKAMVNLYNYPAYNFSNFYQYPGIGFNNMNMSCFGGTPAWLNGGMSGMGNMFGCGPTGTSSSSSSSTCDDPEEEKFKLKYKKLEVLVKALIDSEDLSDEYKADLKVALKNKKGDWEDKFYELYDAYDQIDDGTVKEFLKENGHKIGVSKDIKGKESDSDSFYNRLSRAGFEYKNTATDVAVTDFHTKIATELKSNSGTAIGANNIISNIALKGNVVDFISSWNTKYPDKKIFKYINEHWSKVDSANKENVYSYILTPMVEALIKEAEEVNRYLDDSSSEKMDKAIAALTKALADSKTSVSSSLQAKFDKVYLLTRLGAMQKIREDAAKYYEDIDDGVFNDELFAKETTTDLTQEGFSNSDIQNSSVSIDAKAKSKSSDSDEEDLLKETSKDEKKVVLEEDDEDINIVEFGKGASIRLSGSTDADEMRWIKNRLDALNKDNILQFLNSFYVQEGYGGEGLLEKMDDDDDEEKMKIIDKASKLTIVELTLEKAKEQGLSKSANYIKLQSLLKELERDFSDNTESLDDWYEKPFLGFIGGTKYSEVLDKSLEALHKEMKRKA